MPESFTGVFVFGDSLVDAGNALKLAQTYNYFPFTSLPNGAPTSAKGYYQGRFSDGYTFADLISNKYVGVPTKPVFPFGYDDPYLGISFGFYSDPSGKNLNFAYGGAQIRQGSEAVPDLDDQTDAFRDAVDGDADPNALHMFTFGGNDVHQMVPKSGAWMDLATAQASMVGDANEFSEELRQVIELGVQHILVTGVPDVGIQPGYNGTTNEAARRAAATQYGEMLDALIRSEVDELRASNPGVDITYVSFTGMQDVVFDQLEQIYPASSLYPENNSKIVFFDRLHPTAQLHAIAAAHLLDQLDGSPAGDVVRMVSPDLALSGSISTAGEVDRMTFSLAANTTYSFEMLGISSGKVSNLASWQVLADPRLAILGQGGTVIGRDDDAGMGLDARLTFTTTYAGLYTVELAAVGSLTGVYRLQADNAAVQNDNYRISSASTLVVEGAGGGTDRIYASVSYKLSSGSSIETLSTDNSSGTAAINLTGNEIAQSIVGNAGINGLVGLGGNDSLSGGAGDDRLSGGAGNDVLTGGAGIDTFVIAELGGTDRISDFVRGQDIIDLRQLDANGSLVGDQAFTFVGAATFTNVAGQLRSYLSGTVNYVAGDVNGDGVADFIINLGHIQVQGSDILL
jgi:phospholipase/lecithinase/hemolysin